MTKFTLLIPAIAALAAAAATPWQEQQSGESQLKRVPTAANFDAQEQARLWRSNDLAQRRKTHANLLEWSFESQEVLSTLQGWARGEDLELAWNAELLLRERNLRRQQAPAQRLWPREDLGSPWMRQRQLFDDLQQLFQGPFDPWSQDPWSQGSLGLPQGGTGHSTREGFQLESGPDGVKVQWHEDQNGEQVLRTFEAESLEALLEEHPELRRLLSVGDGLQGFGWSRSPWGSFQRPRAWDGLSSPRRTPWNAAPPRTDVLGVHVSGPDRRQAPIPNVDPDHGMTILNVVPGTLAAQLGLRPGETILTCNETRIQSAADIQRALRMRQAQELLRVEVCDARGVRRWCEWNPEELEMH